MFPTRRTVLTVRFVNSSFSALSLNVPTLHQTDKKSVRLFRLDSLQFFLPKLSG